MTNNIKIQRTNGQTLLFGHSYLSFGVCLWFVICHLLMRWVCVAVAP